MRSESIARGSITSCHWAVQFNANGTLTTSLYVQGADFDIGAVVEINGPEVATVAHKALRNNLYGIPQNSLGYPIHHYVSVTSVPGPRAAGSMLSIVVKNLDGVRSDPFMYTLPASASTLDSDGDTFEDSWESAGHDANNDTVSDVDPYRRDVLVELDVMMTLQNEIAPTSTDAIGTLDIVRAMFAAAPFLNPYTANGINLVIDASGSIPAANPVLFDTGATGSTASAPTVTRFSALKFGNFDDAARGKRYHYVIWGKTLTTNVSGLSDAPWPVAGIEPGDDVFIAGDATTSGTRSQAEILAHELGHNLGQKHGGATDDVWNPLYWSVMSYTWVRRAGFDITNRRRRATCLPIYYASAGENEGGTQHVPPATVGSIIDYSAGMAQMLDERALNELTGVCSQPVDWDHSGPPYANPPSGGPNPTPDADDDTRYSEMMDDFSNWRRLKMDGPILNGTLLP